jgi:protein involved in polysaccharide export with SLBB domain
VSQANPSNAPPVATPQTNLAFSIVHPWQRAAWQEHLTLGPGDVLNFGLFGQPELAVQEIMVGPDGRVSFLEAEDILATGLTVDELRARLDTELGKYHRAPHTLITPVAFRSKKYYMLGKVMVKGAYVLDRPLTVLEAIARAKGFENGLVDRTVVDLADFSRSFVARNGKRLPLDFEKLFQSGDLSQNLPVEPGDYIYIAAAKAEEVYVIGEVRLPGPVPYTPSQTFMAAITARGGFTDRAYRSRVLLVRGSLNEPEAIPVDTTALVSANGTDFRLRPKDIIYVSARPFIRVEELSDLAATAFIQGLISAWVDAKVIKPFNE